MSKFKNVIKPKVKTRATKSHTIKCGFVLIFGCYPNVTKLGNDCLSSYTFLDIKSLRNRS